MSTYRQIVRFVSTFAIVQASWISWLLAGFSTGGIAVVLERAVALIARSKRDRSLSARTRRHSPAESSSNLALSSGW